MVTIPIDYAGSRIFADHSFFVSHHPAFEEQIRKSENVAYPNRYHRSSRFGVIQAVVEHRQRVRSLPYPVAFLLAVSVFSAGRGVL